MDFSTPGFPVYLVLLSPGVCLNSCPLNWWYHPTISSSVALFSPCLQSFPTSGSFLVGQFFASGGQILGASASVLSVNIQGWFPLGLTGLISLRSKGLSRVFSSTTTKSFPTHSKASILWRSAFFTVQLSHPYMTTGKTWHQFQKSLKCDIKRLTWPNKHLNFHHGKNTP